MRAHSFDDSNVYTWGPKDVKFDGVQVVRPLPDIHCSKVPKFLQRFRTEVDRFRFVAHRAQGALTLIRYMPSALIVELV